MPRRERIGYVCSLCGDPGRFPQARLYLRSRAGINATWLLCDPCADMLFDFRGQLSYRDIIEWRQTHEWK